MKRASLFLFALRPTLTSPLPSPPLPPLPPVSDIAHHALSPSANYLVYRRVILGEAPTLKTAGSIAELATTIVSLQAEPSTLCEEDEVLLGTTYSSLERVHAPMQDKQPAESMSWLDTTTTALADRVLYGDDVLYIHCAAGQGRTGLVAACLLGGLYGIGAEEALKRVQAYFDLRGKGDEERSPETDEQVQQVKDFFEFKHWPR